MYSMILKWIFDGALEDPFTEFFIAADAGVKDETRLWHDKYSIRPPMIPKFMTMNQGRKILATGKSINFLKSVCQEDSPIPGQLIKSTERQFLQTICFHPFTMSPMITDF